MLFFVANLPWYLVIGLAYGFGGFINHSLMFGKYTVPYTCGYSPIIFSTFFNNMMTAIHEIGHSRAFGHAKPGANKMLGVFANLPLGIPVFLSFIKYHKYHHMVYLINLLLNYFNLWIKCIVLVSFWWYLRSRHANIFGSQTILHYGRKVDLDVFSTFLLWSPALFRQTFAVYF